MRQPCHDIRNGPDTNGLNVIAAAADAADAEDTDKTVNILSGMKHAPVPNDDYDTDATVSDTDMSMFPYTRRQLNNMNESKLIPITMQHNISNPTSMTPAVIIDSILTSYEKHIVDAVSQRVITERELKPLTVRQLKHVATENNITTNGTRDVIVSNIVEASEQTNSNIDALSSRPSRKLPSLWETMQTLQANLLPL
jgi:hypothetical protein